MLIAFALATPIGAVFALTALRNLSGEALHWAVAFSAGTFLAIATADLLPQVHSHPEGRYKNLLALFAGILVMTIAARGHRHDAPLGETGHDHDHAVADVPAEAAPVLDVAEVPTTSTP
jgi:hypothetical protein